MQKSASPKKHKNTECLLIADIALAELIPAGLIAFPLSNTIESDYVSKFFMGNPLVFQEVSAVMHEANIAIIASALAITFPILYKIDSKLYDTIYKPAAKKLQSLLRRQNKNISESFK